MTNIDFRTQPMFFGAEPNILRDDTTKYKVFNDYYEKMQGFFWRPQEIDLQLDRSDFASLPEGAKHLFTNNLRYQILLDSIQGRGPAHAFMAATSLPEIEACCAVWAQQEVNHSKSYQWMIKNIFHDPSIIFDDIVEHTEIQKRAKSVVAAYDDYIQDQSKYEAGLYVDRFQSMKKLYKALIAVNILEGVRFYVSFACSFGINESLKKMGGSANILRLICRDENVHLGITQNMISIINRGKEGEEWLQVAEECQKDAVGMYIEAVDQEKAWADYLFQEGSIIGLNAAMLQQYVEYIANHRMKAIRLPAEWTKAKKCLHWMDDWISSGKLQEAPQETEKTAYIIGFNPSVKEDFWSSTRMSPSGLIHLP